MRDWKSFWSGFVAGAVTASILILVFDMKPNAFNIGILQFPIPSTRDTPVPQIQSQATPTQQSVQQPKTILNCDSGISGIRGKVFDTKDNTPIVGAFVSTDPGSGSALTDQQGNYLICSVAPRFTYTVTATKNNYNPRSVAVKVNDSLMSTADLTLDRK